MNSSKSIHLRTKIPGPKSIELMTRRKNAVARGPFHSTPVFAKSGKGALIEDVDGNTLIDFASGIGVVNVGHAPESVSRAISNQAAELIHSGFNVAPHESYITLAEKLNKLTPGSFPKKTFLANSGAEAVENAVKIARAFTSRQAIVCFDHAFHGRTYMAMALTAKSKPYKYGFAPFPAEVYRAPFPYIYRSDIASSNEDEVSEKCFKVFEDLVNSQIGPQAVAAVIIEPVLGEGGFLPAPKRFIQLLQNFCKTNGIVTIADEIQSGFGRTGTLFASEQLEFEPDLVTMAKGLGGGMPISAVVGRAEIMDAPMDGGIGGTYAGNPVACASAIAVLELFEKDQGELLKKAKSVGETVQKRFLSFKEKYPVVGDVRGIGPMMALELVKDRITKEANKEAAGKLTRYAYENGVLLLSAGTYGNVIRLLVPLSVETAQLAEGLDVIEAGLKAIQS